MARLYFLGIVLIRSLLSFLANLAVKRLQAINAIFLLRRKKDSKLDGKTLVELPEKEIKLVKLEFSPEERQIYDMVRFFRQFYP